MINLNDNYYLTRATLDQTKEIVTVVNTAYGEQFNPYLLDTPEQPIARIDEKKIQSYINDPSTELYVLVNKTTQTVSGTICYLPRGSHKSGYFGLFSLDKEAQGNGTGTQMIQYLESKAKEAGKAKMKLDVSGFARSLHNYYARKGYAATGKTLDWSSNIHWKLKSEFENSDASQFIVMKKAL